MSFISSIPTSSGGIALTSPVVVTPPPLNGKIFPTITISGELNYQVTYDNIAQIAFAVIKQVNHKVILWSKSSYIAAGEFTDADVNARLIELLGSTPEKISASLLALYKTPPVVPVKPAVSPTT